MKNNLKNIKNMNTRRCTPSKKNDSSLNLSLNKINLIPEENVEAQSLSASLFNHMMINLASGTNYQKKKKNSALSVTPSLNSLYLEKNQNKSATHFSYLESNKKDSNTQAFWPYPLSPLQTEGGSEALFPNGEGGTEDPFHISMPLNLSNDKIRSYIYSSEKEKTKSNINIYLNKSKLDKRIIPLFSSPIILKKEKLLKRFYDEKKIIIQKKLRFRVEPLNERLIKYFKKIKLYKKKINKIILGNINTKNINKYLFIQKGNLSDIELNLKLNYTYFQIKKIIDNHKKSVFEINKTNADQKAYQPNPKRIKN